MGEEYRKATQSNTQILHHYQIHASMQATFSMQDMYSLATFLSRRTVSSSPEHWITLKFYLRNSGWDLLQ